jgi:hypothetical protein
MDLTKINFHESERLVGTSNYPMWAFTVERVFRTHHVWDLVTQDVPDNATGTSSVDTPSKSKADSSKKDSLKETGDKDTASASSLEDRREKCLTIFLFPVTATIKTSIKRYGKNPAVIWMRLKKRYGSTSSTRKLDLRRDLQSIKMTDGMTVDQFLHKIDTVITQLADIDEQVDNPH